MVPDSVKFMILDVQNLYIHSHRRYGNKIPFALLLSTDP
jgi:hypothetical protein